MEIVERVLGREGEITISQAFESSKHEYVTLKDIEENDVKHLG